MPAEKREISDQSQSSHPILPPKRIRRKSGLPVTPVPRSSKKPGELLTADEKKVWCLWSFNFLPTLSLLVLSFSNFFFQRQTILLPSKRDDKQFGKDSIRLQQLFLTWNNLRAVVRQLFWQKVSETITFSSFSTLGVLTFKCYDVD